MPKPSIVRKTPLSGLLLDEADQIALVRDADVEVAVGGQDHAVDAALDEVRLGRLVGELDARAAVGRAAGAQPIEGREDPFAFARGRRGQDEALRAGVDDDGDAVLGRRARGRGASWPA